MTNAATVLKKIFNWKACFLIALIVIAFVMVFELFLARNIGDGYTILSMLNEPLLGNLEIWGIKLILFLGFFVWIMAMKFLVWRNSISWRLFTMLIVMLLIQAFVTACFEVIFLFVGTSLQSFIYSLYFIMLTMSFTIITIDLKSIWSYIKLKFQNNNLKKR